MEANESFRATGAGGSSINKKVPSQLAKKEGCMDGGAAGEVAEAVEAVRGLPVLVVGSAAPAAAARSGVADGTDGCGSSAAPGRSDSGTCW